MKFGQRWSTTARCSLLFKCIGSPTSFRSIVPSIIPITVIQIYSIFPILFGLEYFNSLMCLSDFVRSVSSYLSCLQYFNSLIPWSVVFHHIQPIQLSISLIPHVSTSWKNIVSPNVKPSPIHISEVGLQKKIPNGKRYGIKGAVSRSVSSTCAMKHRLQ